MTPKISIIIPTYNREKVIAKTLDCIIAQTYDNWECLVVDDFSSDNTWSILQQYASKDSRIYALKNEKTKGACGARNTGFIRSTGEFVQFFDSDDQMAPTLLEELHGEFSIGVDVVTCWTHVVDVESNTNVDAFEYVSTGNIHEALLTGRTYVDTNCALIKRDVIEKINGWSEDCPSFQEWDFHLRLSKYARYTTLKKHLINYYVGGADTISKSQYKWLIGMLYILSKYKNEWLLRCPLNYIKRLYAFYSQLMNFKGNEIFDKVVDDYNHKVTCFFRIVVLLIYAIKKI